MSIPRETGSIVGARAAVGVRVSDDQHEKSKLMSDETSNRTTREGPTLDGVVVLEIRNRHVARGHRIDVAPDAYVSYFENTFGDQLVFVRRRSERHATLWQGEDAWKPVRIAAILRPSLTIRLDDDELDWLNACRSASGLAPRQPERPIKPPA